MKKLVIIGGGFAGFWSAVSAVRQARELNKSDELNITLISKDEFHTIKPRLYEHSIEGTRITLRRYCEPLNIDLVIGEVTGADPAGKTLSLANRQDNIVYDYLILAAGGRLKTADIPGFEKTFNVDTFEAASELDRHLRGLSNSGFNTAASRNVVVVGGGLTGLEVATSMRKRLEYLAPSGTKFKVFMVEKAVELASGFSSEGREYIRGQLNDLGVKLLLGDKVGRIDDRKISLKSGGKIETETVVWTAGVEATPLTKYFNGEKDELGRCHVDTYLKLFDYDTVFAAGDAAKVMVDNENYALMSCQHTIPQGKFAGHNAVNHMFGAKMKPYSQPGYTTCVDLGPENALSTTGWERSMGKTGSEAKSLKTQIVTMWIYPSKDVEETIRMSVPETPKL